MKESLNKLALDVHDDDDDEDLSIYASPQQRDQLENWNSVSDRRRVSRNFNNGSATPTQSPIANGLGSPSNHEIEQYKIEIKRLRESEAEIKALSVNYAALLKEKENQISRLTEANELMKHNLHTANSSKSIPKVSGDISPSSHNKAPNKARPSGSSLSNGDVAKHDALSNGTTSAYAKELLDTVEEKNKSLAMMQASHEAQMKQMVVELDNEHHKLASMHQKLQEEQKLNGSLQQELNLVKDENNKMLQEMRKTHGELTQKVSQIGRLQEELQRREQEESNDTIEKLKNTIASLRDENTSIKVIVWQCVYDASFL